MLWACSFAMQIDSDIISSVGVSVWSLAPIRSARTGNVLCLGWGALPPPQRSCCLSGLQGMVWAWAGGCLAGSIDTTGVKTVHTCQVSFPVSKCRSLWSEVAEGGKRKSWLLKAERCVWYAFSPYVEMRSCNLDVTDKIPSTSAGLLNSTPATGKWCFQESLSTIFKIRLNFRNSLYKLRLLGALITFQRGLWNYKLSGPVEKYVPRQHICLHLKINPNIHLQSATTLFNHICIFVSKNICFHTCNYSTEAICSNYV